MPIACTELYWDQIRKEVAKLNPTFAKIIDELNPGKKFTLFKVKYNFGDEILRRAKLHLPTLSGNLVPLDNNQISPHVREALSYNFGSNPVGLLLKNSVELFIQSENMALPFAIIGPGRLFGAWKILDTDISYLPADFPWGMTAGARSIFMLPKISETISHSKLSKRFQLRTEKPNLLMDHWEVFREIANHKDFGSPWEIEILFFSAEWFKKLHDSDWSKFKLYLLDAAWQGSGYWRNQFMWRFIFSLVEQKKNIRAPAYIFDTARHLIALSVGALPGFEPAVDDLLAPIKRLQDVYVDSTGYGLKKYAPIIMQPSTFSMNAFSNPVYYSLQYSTRMEFSLKSSERISAITEIHLLESLLKKYLIEIQENEFEITKTPLEFLVNHIEFSYFHNNAEDYRGLRESSKISAEDTAFLQASGDYKKLPFPKNSSFFNGCIRISYRDN